MIQPRILVIGASGQLGMHLRRDAARGALFDDSGDLRRLIGRPTTKLSASVAAALKAA